MVVSEDSARISWPLSSANKAEPNLFCFLQIFKARKFSIGYFEGKIKVPEFFWVLLEALGLFLAF